jgi:hypothetical protein
MSQYPGGQYPGGPPQYDPYYGRPADPYAPPPQQQPSDPYLGQPGPADPYYGQPQDPYAQQAAWQAWQAHQQAWWQSQQQQQAAPRSRGGVGAAVAGIFLVLLGAWFLFRDQISVDLGQTWPVLAVVLGVVMVIAAFIPRRS